MSNDINVKLATLQQGINITSNASFRKEVKMINYISCFRESFNFLIVAISSKCNISMMESKSIKSSGIDLFGVDMIILKVWPVGHAEFTFLCETHQMVEYHSLL